VHAIALMLAAGAAVQGRACAAGLQPRVDGAEEHGAEHRRRPPARLPNGMPASTLTSPQAQQQRAGEQLQRSIGNLNIAARGIAAQQAAQEAARRAAHRRRARACPTAWPKAACSVDTASLTAGWANANAPVPTQQAKAARRSPSRRPARKAILNWETFNVGRNTTLKFEQQPSWAVLNRVNDPNARPSRIQGQVQADGTVLVVNRNGIVFSGGSQVEHAQPRWPPPSASATRSSSSGLYSHAHGNGLRAHAGQRPGRDAPPASRTARPRPT
jgi:filamentous hemagglutinin family protein